MNEPKVTANTTVKLDETLRLRISRAMQAEGAQVFSEWARRAFTRRCREIEDDLRVRHPAEYERVYGSPPPPAPGS